jgi:hypothetical protein
MHSSHGLLASLPPTHHARELRGAHSRPKSKKFSKKPGFFFLPSPGSFSALQMTTTHLLPSLPEQAGETPTRAVLMLLRACCVL